VYGIVFIETAAETDAAARANCGRSFKTKVRPALLALPPGTGNENTPDPKANRQYALDL